MKQNEIVNKKISEIITEVNEMIFPKTIDFSNLVHVNILSEKLESFFDKELSDVILNNVLKLNDERNYITEETLKTKLFLSEIIKDDIVLWNMQKSNDSVDYFVTGANYIEAKKSFTELVIEEHKDYSNIVHDDNERKTSIEIEGDTNRTVIIEYRDMVEAETKKDEKSTEEKHDTKYMNKYIKSKVIREAIPQDKLSDFEHYFSKVNKFTPAASNLIKLYFNSLSDDISGTDVVLEFSDLLYSKNRVEDVVIEDVKSSKTAQGLFGLEPKGVGKGEIFYSVMVKDCIIMGGSVDYDLESGGKKYEIKDVAGSNEIRLGMSGRITNFNFFSKIITTLNLLNEYSIDSIDNSYIDEETLNYINDIKTVSDKIYRAELSKATILLFINFYKKVNEIIEGAPNEFQKIVFKGTASSVQKKIKSIKDTDVLDKKSITIDFADDTESDIADDLLHDLEEKVEYVKKPNDFVRDVFIETPNKIKKWYSEKGIEIIIFKKTEIKYLQKFEFNRVTGGGVKLKV